MIYFDNAATSFPKPSAVIEEMCKCMRYYCANPGRGGHSMSVSAAKAIFEAREAISSFFNINDPLRLCFTKNATEALNIAIKGSVEQGDHVITTSLEHNSVLRPLKTMEKEQGIGLTIVRADEHGMINPDDFKNHITAKTRLIVCSLSSNVTGMVLPVREIGKLAKDNGILFLLDASQGAGCKKIDVSQLNVDMLAFSGHKGLLGPQGTGGLYIRNTVKIKPIIQGGTGSDSGSVYQPEFMPDMLESGTMNVPGIVGLCHGVDFIKKVGIDNIEVYKHHLTKTLIDGLKEIKGTKVYSSDKISENTGVVALNIEGFDSTEVSYLLDSKFNVVSRPGLHCAPLAHEDLGTSKTGIVRLSPGCFNTVDEVEYTLDALKRIAAGD